MRPVTLLTTVVMKMEFIKKKVLKCRLVAKDVGICLLIPATIPLVIAEVADIGLLIPATIPLVIVEVILSVMLVEVYRGQKILVIIPILIVEKIFMLKGEVDIGLRTSILPPITQASVLDFRLHYFFIIV